MSHHHQHKHRSVTSSSWLLGQAVSTTRVTPLSTPWSCAHLAQGCTPIPMYLKCPGVAALRQRGLGDPLLPQAWPWEPPQDHSAHPCSTLGRQRLRFSSLAPQGQDHENDRLLHRRLGQGFWDSTARQAGTGIKETLTLPPHGIRKLDPIKELPSRQGHLGPPVGTPGTAAAVGRCH